MNTVENMKTLYANKRFRIDAVYVDFAKAFDTVTHNQLLIKLAGYGFGHNLMRWMSSFPKGRTQCVYRI